MEFTQGIPGGNETLQNSIRREKSGGSNHPIETSYSTRQKDRLPITYDYIQEYGTKTLDNTSDQNMKQVIENIEDL